MNTEYTHAAILSGAAGRALMLKGGQEGSSSLPSFPRNCSRGRRPHMHGGASRVPHTATPTSEKRGMGQKEREWVAPTCMRVWEQFACVLARLHIL